MRVLAEIEAGGRGRAAGAFYKSGYPRSTRAAKTGFMQDSLAAAVVPRSLAMARESLIRCRVSDDVKGLLQAIAAQRQMTESALVRQLIEAMVQMVTNAKIADGDASKRVVRDARLYVRLAPEDRILLSDRATARGMASAHLRFGTCAVAPSESDAPS